MHDFILDPTLQARIRTVAHGDPDVAQAVRLRLLELAEADPAFGQQRVGYHIKRAAWEARHAREKAVVYDRYVASEPHVVDEETGEPASIFDEHRPAPGLIPEQAVIESETRRALLAAVDALPATQRQIARLFLAGYQPGQIARRLGVTKSNVSHQMKRLTARLAEAL